MKIIFSLRIAILWWVGLGAVTASELEPLIHNHIAVTSQFSNGSIVGNTGEPINGIASEAHHHNALDGIFPRTSASHVAVADGDWSQQSTWENGMIPNSSADVLIPTDLTVTYDVDVGVALNNIRVDGTLKWSTEKSTTMRVDTIVTALDSNFIMGNEVSPIPANVSAKIVFVDGALSQTLDPEFLTRGLVAFGEVDIHGAAKVGHRVISGNAEAGDTTISLIGPLSGWRAGDSVVVVGTGENSADEVRTISSINGSTITLDTALSENHLAPSGFDFDTYVINTSRNIQFMSQNPNGVRGHVMLHDGIPDADGLANQVRYAEFIDLGRTNKLIDTSANNPIGRYPLHLHKTGADFDAAISILEGNAVIGSPGWGLVQHSSNALLLSNVVQNTTGAGMVSEVGNENGVWRDNFVTGVIGRSDAIGALAGDEGAAYENQSRVVLQENNVAANALIGWNFSGREDFLLDGLPVASTVNGKHRKMFERQQLRFDPSPFDVAIDHEEPAISDFNDNTVMATNLAFRVFHRQYSDDSDTMSVINNFTVWGGGSAIALDNYASNYLFKDAVLHGSDIGFQIERKTSSVVFVNVDFNNFELGYRSYGVNHEVVLVNTQFNNVSQLFDVRDMTANINDEATKQSLITYYNDSHSIDYRNPVPNVINGPVSSAGLSLSLAAGSDLTIGLGDNRVDFTGTTTDSLGARRFNEYVIAKTPSGNGTSKDFEGININFLSNVPETGRQKDFTVNEFLDVHGTYQKANGVWVSPTVHWLTERLSGDQYPVIIEVNLNGFDDAYLIAKKLASYPNPTINNPGFNYGFDLLTGKRTTSGSATPATPDNAPATPDNAPGTPGNAPTSPDNTTADTVMPSIIMMLMEGENQDED